MSSAAGSAASGSADSGAVLVEQPSSRLHRQLFQDWLEDPPGRSPAATG